ncbi:TPA: hypothetical protein N0F65_007548 [Lagenidium giganteum]|uniref:DUF6818 domain-containing protein n=1 Tax=Lagenidium giganteum TaxID=4803 RepID=A0AAV2ZHU7_9STRA|nr:TPA: hypothetical protein N0F65_007548 [Lagenidium giganteum]
MLDIVEAHFPFGQEQWERVASKYNENLPGRWPQRDGSSLKRKFQEAGPSERTNQPKFSEPSWHSARLSLQFRWFVCTTMTMIMTAVTRTMAGMKMIVRMNRLWQATAFSVQPMLMG